MESNEHEALSAGHENLLPELTSPIDPLVEVEGVEQTDRFRRSRVDSEIVPKLNQVEFTVFERLDYLWRTHNYISGNFRLADAKAAVTIVFGSTIVGSLYAAQLHKPLFTVPLNAWSATTWLEAATFTVIGASILLSAISVQPRLWNTEGPDHIYWKNILSHKSVEDYWNHFRKEKADDLEHGLCTNIFAISTVCQKKYRLIRLSMWLGLLGGGMAVFLLLIRP